jgi:recombination protein RecA
VKNKVAPPFRQVEFDLIYGKGISKYGDLLDLGVANDIITKSGTWFSYNENRIGQGRENSKRFLSENLELSAEIEERLRKTLGLVPSEGNVKEGAEELPTKGKKAEKNS